MNLVTDDFIKAREVKQVHDKRRSNQVPDISVRYMLFLKKPLGFSVFI